MRDDLYNASPEPAFDSEQAEVTRRRAMLLGLLRGRWHWALLLAVLLGVSGGYLGYHSQDDQYKAGSSIDIRPNYNNIAVSITDLSVYEPYVNFVNGEMRRLVTQEVIEKAMAQPEWQDNLAQRPTNLPEMTISAFADAIQIREPDRDSTTIGVEFVDQHPGTARAGLNSLLVAYKQEQEQDQSQDITNNIRLLNDQLQNLKNQKTALENQRQLVVPDDELETVRARLNAKLGELANMEFKLKEVDLRVGPYLEADRGAPTPEVLRELMLQDPTMARMLEQRELLERRIRELTEVLNRGEGHNDVMQTRRTIALLERDIAEFEADWMNGEHKVQVPQEVRDLIVLREGMLAQIDQLNAEVQDLSSKITAVGEYQIEIEGLTERIRSTNVMIDDLERTRPLVAQDDISRVVVGPLAATPTRPSNTDKRKQMAGVGGIGGFFLGFGLVMAVGLSDRRLRHVSDTAVGMPDANVLGILPTLPADLKDPEDAETAAHCVHHIRTLLQIGGANRVFSITSPAAGSGKSSLATALGMSFATSGASTLVIDCDLVGAGLSRRMGTVVHEPLDAVIRKRGMLDEVALAQAITQATTQSLPLDEVLLEQGLLDAEQIEVASRLQRDTALGLLDACAPGRLRSCVASTGMDNFFVLPVGNAKPSDASRLSPAAIRELIRQAREAFDIVLVDTGPVLGSLEASIAAAEADATLLIVSRGDQKSLASRTLAQLRSVNANIAGVVFNHALERDLAHTSYASIVSQERRPDRSERKRRLDKTRSARLGPLGTAVASYTEEDASGEAVAANGQHNGNGHAPD